MPSQTPRKPLLHTLPTYPDIPGPLTYTQRPLQASRLINGISKQSLKPLKGCNICVRAICSYAGLSGMSKEPQVRAGLSGYSRTKG
ncbi:hypothetical protein AQUCO_00700001v1 [Aquilegia coerulea]|uniref:Uncharacterized protein n=1 Tax=Aquilegia coerulea TaxID=218851 RepID=A0A2G5EI58_AQUCA|nr:hypothetical protein AQUCO_00700001v1 [Aquilegia coerulea]